MPARSDSQLAIACRRNPVPHNKFLIWRGGDLKNFELHEFTVIARGNHLIQKIDGQLACEIIDHEVEKRSLEGILGIQLHRGPAMKVQVRDVWLKVLPDGGILSPAGYLFLTQAS